MTLNKVYKFQTSLICSGYFAADRDELGVFFADQITGKTFVIELA